MIYCILSGVGVICFFIALLLLFLDNNKHILLQGIMFIVGLSLTICMVPAAIVTSVIAKDTYSEMMSTKKFIETNYTCSDLLTDFKVNQEYYKYMFKLERIKESKECGIFSMYYTYDIDTLELVIEK